MKRALLISISTIVAVWLADRCVAYVVRRIYHSYRSPTTTAVVDLVYLKFELTFVLNVLFSTILFFVLRRQTNLNKTLRIALCVAVFIANFLFFRYFKAWG